MVGSAIMVLAYCKETSAGMGGSDLKMVVVVNGANPFESIEIE
jgi:hypothetical protein